MSKKSPLLWLLLGAVALGTLLYSGQSQKAPETKPVPVKPPPDTRPAPKPAPPCPH